MKKMFRPLYACALSLCVNACQAQAPASPAQTTPAIKAVASADSSRAGAAEDAASRPGRELGHKAPSSLCAAAETVVFSCPLAHRSRVVSLCASPNAQAFRYVFGQPSKPELVFPTEADDGAEPFHGTHLTFGGATGGTAYSFTKGGYKYVLYSISGTGLRDGGVLVQRVGDAHALSDMKCQEGKITESESDAIIDATMAWKPDPDIRSRGLPRVSK